MDKRDNILNLLENYKSIDNEEEKLRLKFINFVNSHIECFDNDFKLGHVTGAALVVDKDIQYTLLTLHSVINMWFQFGGHSDSQSDVINTAFREASEESGLKSLTFIPGHEGIFDVDIHTIPVTENMPEHLHYDIRIILTADINEPYIVSHESKDLQWVKLEEAEKYNQQPAFLRLIKKAIDLRKSL
jgi:8-oxo-dGTP pyrophosphatase MutT (NUDIX family)